MVRDASKIHPTGRECLPRGRSLVGPSLGLIWNGAAKTQIVVQIRRGVLMSDATGRPHVRVVPGAPDLHLQGIATRFD
jgi:hypothetical protein